MEKISWTIKKVPEFKIFLSVILILISSLALVFIYGFGIGGSYLSEKFLCFTIFTSLAVSFLISFFMFGKSFLKKFYNKEYRERHIWGIICLILIVIQFFFYSSINKIFADYDNVKVLEVEIVEIDNSFLPKSELPSSADLYFIDSKGDLNSVWYEYFYETDEVLPSVGGTVVVKEIEGAFGYSLFELVKIKT